MTINFPLLFSTFFYVGKIKYAPGTVASFLTLILWASLVPENFLLRFVIVLFLILVGFIATEKSLSFFKEKDPQSIVIDEVVGMSISLLFITDITLMLLAFILFRITTSYQPIIAIYRKVTFNTYNLYLNK